MSIISTSPKFPKKQKKNPQARNAAHRCAKWLHLQQLHSPLSQRRRVHFAQRQRAALAAEQRHGDGDHGVGMMLSQ